MLITILVCITILIYSGVLIYGLIENKKSKNDIMVSMLMNTEANEQVNFSFKLNDDMDKDTMVTKINNIFEVSEQRRTFQYKRMEDLRKKAIEDAETMNQKEISVLRS
jgi:hypothetical protein